MRHCLAAVLPLSFELRQCLSLLFVTRDSLGAARDFVPIGPTPGLAPKPAVGHGPCRDDDAALAAFLGPAAVPANYTCVQLQAAAGDQCGVLAEAGQEDLCVVVCGVCRSPALPAASAGVATADFNGDGCED
eukprot:SAG22_NODE_1264_length_4966_cov_1.918430_3_plen_132_part_00